MLELVRDRLHDLFHALAFGIDSVTEIHVNASCRVSDVRGDQWGLRLDCELCRTSWELGSSPEEPHFDAAR